MAGAPSVKTAHKFFHLTSCSSKWSDTISVISCSFTAKQKFSSYINLVNKYNVKVNCARCATSVDSSSFKLNTPLKQRLISSNTFDEISHAMS
jgi:hypothetical protein